MQLKAQQNYYSPEDYLKLEETAEYKSEYRDGEIIPMTGGTTNHNQIALNIATLFKLGLKGKHYKIYIGDVRLWIPRYRQYTYPDVMVIQGEPVYTGKGTTTVMNPMLIVEVLSNSTKNYDQGDKFLYYRSISEFKEYILIEQSEYRLLQYNKTATNQWQFTEYESENSVISINSLELSVSFPDIYEGVNFKLTQD
ncbi:MULTISPECIES: Uma2 family endonuclease [unclassified Moorena]|uniref:Uma2 family endonuclease n=1 Tax=unclassified Moorena TaxID=2683338 RepID=UPI0013FF3E4E|nr:MULTISPECIES: Uma2 family endonuclease [unclassified Moorena]NEO12082.1 Uma2 family endonuclease [Moorena sp. SIO3E8]NEQ03539.1 Uma2 family endonuclease [Moorena sp. SIO3F7]